MILPSIRTFKISVHFPIDGMSAHSSEARTAPECAPDPAWTFDTQLLRRLQEPFPLTEQPWNQIAQDLSMSVEQLFAAVQDHKNHGAIKRIAAVVRHRALGFTANCMACFAVPEDAIVSAGEAAAAFPQISHCYQRQTFPLWPYSLYCMVHARSTAECGSIVDSVARGIRCADSARLFSQKELKKERVKYFIG
jgi:DNA-binding Lrp family transcriptional regulator